MLKIKDIFKSIINVHITCQADLLKYMGQENN